jgi:hypothetical protein
MIKRTFKKFMADEKQAAATALVNQLQELKAEAQGIAQKIGEFDQERVEHALVAETLSTLDGSRKCYRYCAQFDSIFTHQKTDPDPDAQHDRRCLNRTNCSRSASGYQRKHVQSQSFSVLPEVQLEYFFLI